MAKLMKKRNTTGGGLYIALAICVLSVICIGVYSAVNNILDTSSLNATDKVPTETKAPAIPTPSTSKKPATTTPQNTEAPQVSAGADNKEEADKNVNAQPTPPATYTMPVAGDVSKEFSNDILVYSETMNDYRVHNGTDLTATVGTPVKAFTSGTVESIHEDPLMGYTVVVDHGGGMKSTYSGLSDAFPEGLEKGSKVKEGQVIGGVGESCLIECAQEPHLHFEVMVNEKYVDPLGYFE